MITKIRDFYPINEIRLPHGFFLVEETFMLSMTPEGEENSASSVFNKGSYIEINANQKYIKKWSRMNTDGTTKGEWKSTIYPWIDLMDPKAYPEFKRFTSRLEPAEVPDFYKTGKDLAKTFTTSYHNLNKRLADYKLDPSARIKIIIL